MDWLAVLARPVCILIVGVLFIVVTYCRWLPTEEEESDEDDEEDGLPDRWP